jgi:NADP-dependent 3-hydroxy acid dehydrogenase YdfG
MGEAVRADLNDTGIRTTLIEPGGTETPFFDNPSEGRLEADDIARAVIYAVSQPPHVSVNEVLVRPSRQR